MKNLLPPPKGYELVTDINVTWEEVQADWMGFAFGRWMQIGSDKEQPWKRVARPIQTGVIRRRLRHALHNLIAHPLAGLCWLAGWQAGGDWLHEHL